MAVRLTDTEDDEFVILVWNGGRDDVVPNAAGVAVAHLTRMVNGSAILDVKGFETVTMKAGSEVTIPARTPYKVIGLEDGEVHCFYPKSSLQAMADINHLRLRGGGPGTVRSMFEGMSKDTLPDAEKPGPSVREETGVIVLVPRLAGTAETPDLVVGLE